MARLKISSEPVVKYSLVVTVLPDGTYKPNASLIKHRGLISNIVDISKQCLQKFVREKLALMKLVRYDYADHTTGTWIGANHVSIILDLKEYKFILGSTTDDDSGKESEGKRQEDSGQISLDL